MPTLDRFPFYKQWDGFDCGPACLRMIMEYHGRKTSYEAIRRETGLGRMGVDMLGIAQAGEQLSLKTMGVKISVDKLREVPLPCILYLPDGHFVVLYKITRRKRLRRIFQSDHDEVEVFYRIADPAIGKTVMSSSEMAEAWTAAILDGERVGIALLLQPSVNFATGITERSDNALLFSDYFKTLFKHRALFFQIGIGVLAGSLIQLAIPFLTQILFDKGLEARNFNLVHLILVAQISIVLIQNSIDFVRGWTMLHITSRVNLSFLTEFFSKIFRLSVSYFEHRHSGEILQRIGDHTRIESFFTGNAIHFIFSFFNIFVYGFLLLNYSLPLFTTAIVLTMLNSAWIIVFIPKRRALDKSYFQLNSHNQNLMTQIIHGIVDIKLNGAELHKRWEWERTQVKIFGLNVTALSIGQIQRVGNIVFSQLQYVTITYFSVTAVMDGSLTIGGMMTLQYLVAQFMNPLNSILGFVTGYQDAKLSLARLNEIHGLPDEDIDMDHSVIDDLGRFDIHVQNLCFSYVRGKTASVLNGVSFSIPRGRVTAIVGESGSGKSTIIKLLLKFYDTEANAICLGEPGGIDRQGLPLVSIPASTWRNRCSAVMQGGYIFTDSIARNIAIGDEEIDLERLTIAAKAANIYEFVNSLPLRFYTVIGKDGAGISEGQKQRILIARALYRKPDFLFLDEATNSLDARNEMSIVENIKNHFSEQTMVVVAHRLSTIRHAHQIIVLQGGEVVEIGTHDQLLWNNGVYAELVKKQVSSFVE